MARKRTLIPAFPVESRLLSWVLFVAGVALVVTGWATDEAGLLMLGGVCVAGALLALVADRLLRDVEDEESGR